MTFPACRTLAGVAVAIGLLVPTGPFGAYGAADVPTATSSPAANADELIERARDRLAAHDLEGALGLFRAAAEADRTRGDTRAVLAFLLHQSGRSREAIPVYREAIALAPDDPAPRNVLAWILATSPDPDVRNAAEAVREAEKATELTDRENPDTLDTLAAAYAERGDFAGAVATADECLALLEQLGEGELLRDVQARRRLYESRQPFHTAPAESAGSKR